MKLIGALLFPVGLLICCESGSKKNINVPVPSAQADAHPDVNSVAIVDASASGSAAASFVSFQPLDLDSDLGASVVQVTLGGAVSPKDVADVAASIDMRSLTTDEQVPFAHELVATGPGEPFKRGIRVQPSNTKANEWYALSVAIPQHMKVSSPLGTASFANGRVGVRLSFGSSPVISSVRVCRGKGVYVRSSESFEADKVRKLAVTLDGKACMLNESAGTAGRLFSFNCGANPELGKIVRIQATEPIVSLGGVSLRFKPFGTASFDETLQTAEFRSVDENECLAAKL